MNPSRTAVITLALLASPSSSARDIHVDNSTGDDRYRGQALIVFGGQGPLRTLQKAVRIAKPGDRIVINPSGSPFREEVIINGVERENPTASFPIVIEGNGAILDGLVPVDPQLARPMGDGLFQFETDLGPSHTSDFLFVDGTSAPRGLDRQADGTPKLKPGEFAVWNGRLCYQLAPNDVIDRHTFAASRLNVGLTNYRSSHWIVRNLGFRGYRLDGVRIHGPVEGLQFEHCRFLSNGRAGFANYGLADAGISDSEAIGNGKAAFVGRNFARLGLVRNRTEGNPIAVDSDPSASARVTAGDPIPSPTPPPKQTPSAPAGERKRRSTPRREE